MWIFILMVYPKGHVIDNSGKACKKKVVDTGASDEVNLIIVGKLEVTSDYPKNKKGESTKNKIAKKGETIYYIPLNDSDEWYFKVESKKNSRNNIIWKRHKEELLSHGRNVGFWRYRQQGQRKGLFGPGSSAAECFKIPFGLKVDDHKPSGVWIAANYYREVMLPEVDNSSCEIKPEIIDGDPIDEIKSNPQPVQQLVSYDPYNLYMQWISQYIQNIYPHYYGRCWVVPDLSLQPREQQQVPHDLYMQSVWQCIQDDNDLLTTSNCYWEVPRLS